MDSRLVLGTLGWLVDNDELEDLMPANTNPGESV